MGYIKEIRERRDLINSSIACIYYVSKKARIYQDMRLRYKKIYNGINTYTQEQYIEYLLSAFKILNYEVLRTNIEGKEYIVLTRNFEKSLIYIEKNINDVKNGYFSNAITVSFTASVLHCNSKYVITELKGKQINEEYISDCKTHGITIMDYSWHESVYKLIMNNLSNKYDYCKEKIKEESNNIIKIKNEPIKRTKEKTRYNISDIITNNDLKQVQERLSYDIIENVYEFEPIK